jgi:hypothetical protein
MQGMKTVHRGQTVWLFVYYTVSQVPRQTSRYQTYTIMHGSKTVSSRTYKGTQHKHETGRYARFDTWVVAAKQPTGTYVFKGMVQLGSQKKTSTWKFAVAK